MEITGPGQLEKAELEDTLVDMLYKRYPGLVFHGGTAIWRCYSGNRFSRDLDFYMEAKRGEDKMLRYREILEFLQESGFRVKEKGYNRSMDTMHFLVESGGASMKVDINFKYREGTTVDYEKVTSGRLVVLSLSPIELLDEKITAYRDKLDDEGRFKHPEAHDLYDMYYLVQIIKDPDPSIVERLRDLIDEIRDRPPYDIRSLDHLMLSGLAPSFELMMKGLRGWINDNGQGDI